MREGREGGGCDWRSFVNNRLNGFDVWGFPPSELEIGFALVCRGVEGCSIQIYQVNFVSYFLFFSSYFMQTLASIANPYVFEEISLGLLEPC